MWQSLVDLSVCLLTTAQAKIVITILCKYPASGKKCINQARARSCMARVCTQERGNLATCGRASCI